MFSGSARMPPASFAERMCACRAWSLSLYSPRENGSLKISRVAFAGVSSTSVPLHAMRRGYNRRDLAQNRLCWGIDHVWLCSPDAPAAFRDFPLRGPDRVGGRVREAPQRVAAGGVQIPC